MPRAHGPGRGTRRYRGVQSGVTWATIPSGVTIDYTTGIDSDRNISGSTFVTNPSGVTFDYRGFYTPSGFYMRFNAATVAWAGASLSITHGFSTLYGFHASLIGTGSGTSVISSPHVYDQGYATTLALSFRTVTNNAIITTGGTVTWIAMGLV